MDSQIGKLQLTLSAFGELFLVPFQLVRGGTRGWSISSLGKVGSSVLVLGLSSRYMWTKYDVKMEGRLCE